MAVTSPSVALLGGGYTLTRLAEKLTPGTFVMTSRSDERCAVWRQRGWLAAKLDLSRETEVEAFFSQYPALSVVIDSVPPLRESKDPASGVKLVARAVKQSPITQVIYLSTTGVFGVRDGSLVNEATPPAPWNPQGEARLQSELAYRMSGKRVCAMRLPAIYGFDRGVLHSVRNGTYRLIGSGENWTNRIHVADLVMTLEHALGCLHLPDILCVSDDMPARARDVVSFICEHDGLPIPPSLSEEEALRMGAYTMLSNQRVVNDKVKATLGIQLQYPSYREGLYG